MREKSRLNSGFALSNSFCYSVDLLQISLDAFHVTLDVLHKRSEIFIVRLGKGLAKNIRR